MASLLRRAGAIRLRCVREKGERERVLVGGGGEEGTLALFVAAHTAPWLMTVLSFAGAVLRLGDELADVGVSSEAVLHAAPRG
eukprot:gene56424-42637_t